MKILLTGGHLTPALAMIEYIQQTHPQDELVFVGRLFSQPKHQQLAQEKNEVEKQGVKFIPFSSPRLSRSHSRPQKMTIPFRLLGSILKAQQILLQEKPDVILSFGGYLAVPVVIAAKLKRIPTVTHEQTRAAGFSNQFIARFANHVAISHQSSAQYFPHNQVTLTGNPLRSALFKKSPQKPEWLKTKVSQPILLVMGGNQGSQLINQVVGKILTELTQKWTVVHISGRSTRSLNYMPELTALKKKLPKKQQDNYYIQEWVGAAELSWLYPRTIAALTRAGANTVDELIAFQIPTVFVPLRSSHHQEQHKNAQALVEKGAALLLEEDELKPSTLLTTLEQLISNQSQLKSKLAEIETSQNAADKIYRLLTHAIQQ